MGNTAAGRSCSSVIDPEILPNFPGFDAETDKHFNDPGSGTNQISLEELVDWFDDPDRPNKIKRLSPSAKKYANKVFKQLDKRESGKCKPTDFDIVRRYITYNDVSMILQDLDQLYPSRKKDLLEELYIALDTDKNGTISNEEFGAWLDKETGWKSLTAKVRGEKEKVVVRTFKLSDKTKKGVFAQFDKDGDSEVTKEEFVEFFDDWSFHEIQKLTMSTLKKQPNVIWTKARAKKLKKKLSDPSVPEHEKETLAASKIQASFRGHKARKEKKKMTKAATTIQKNFRGHKVRKEKRNQEKAAVKIQKLYRGHRARKSFAKFINSPRKTTVSDVILDDMMGSRGHKSRSSSSSRKSPRKSPRKSSRSR